MKRLLLWFVLAGSVVAIVLASGVAWRVYAPLPRVSGQDRLEGLVAPVEVLRDERGVPHIRATTDLDAFMALGWVHAQDRLWQMEFQRRLAAGRLAEILGPAALDIDRLFRTIGIAEAAASTWARTDDDTRTVVLAYVKGVNAFLAAHRGRRLPIEFGLLGVEPEPWAPEHVVAWSKVMAWQLGADWRDELLRTRIAARAGLDAVAVLMPAYTEGAPVIVPEGPQDVPDAEGDNTIRPDAPTEAVASADLTRWLVAFAEQIETRLGPTSSAASNNWVVSGSRTATGRPLLANDPHLGAQLPSVWYLAHLTGDRLDVIGATLPGAPGVIIGHNGRVAWGVTNLMADVQDLFIERLDAAGRAEFDGVMEPLSVRHEVIRVKDAPDATLRVRSSRHGPIVSDLFDEVEDARALSLRWTGHDADDPTIAAFLRVGYARSWDEFVAAFDGFHSPPQNFVYADVDGHIGYIAPGSLPMRGESDGRMPSPGWSSDFAWRGYRPAAASPRLANPTRGFIATANNPPFEGDAARRISESYEPGYRAARITDRLESAEGLTIEAMVDLQRDVVALEARALLPWLRRADPPDEASRMALDRLRGWDGTMAAGSAEAAIFAAWHDALLDVLFEDDLGPGLVADWRARMNLSAKALHRMRLTSDDRWCDDVRTPGVERCETMFGRALALGLSRMADAQGTDRVERWRWGRANAVVFPHLPLAPAPWLGRALSRVAEVGGTATTVSPVMRLGSMTYVASYRQVIDLADVDRSVFVLTLGQSGQWGSAQYDDQLKAWKGGTPLTIPFSADAVDRAITTRLVLAP